MCMNVHAFTQSHVDLFQIYTGLEKAQLIAISKENK